MKHCATSTTALIAVMSIVLIACGEPFVFSPEGVSGTYILATINGNSLPTESTDGERYTAWSVTLNVDGSYLSSVTLDGNTFEFGWQFFLEEPDIIRLGSQPSLGSVGLQGTLVSGKLTLYVPITLSSSLDDFDTFVFRK